MLHLNPFRVPPAVHIVFPLGSGSFWPLNLYPCFYLFIYFFFFFVQGGLWWDWRTESWKEWASCRKPRGSTSCSRSCSSASGRKSGPFNFSHKVEIVTFSTISPPNSATRSSQQRRLFHSVYHLLTQACKRDRFLEHMLFLFVSGGKDSSGGERHLALW